VRPGGMGRGSLIVPEAGAVIVGEVTPVLGSEEGAGDLKVPSGGLLGDGLASFIYGPGVADGCDTAGNGAAAAAHDAHDGAQLPPSQTGDAQPSHAEYPAPPQLAQDGYEEQVGHAGAKQAEVAHVGQAAQAGAAQQAGSDGA